MCNYFKIRSLVKDKLFKGFLSLALVAILFIRAERFEQFGRGSLMEFSCEFFLKLGKWPWRRIVLRFFYF